MANANGYLTVLGIGGDLAPADERARWQRRAQDFMDLFVYSSRDADRGQALNDAIESYAPLLGEQLKEGGWGQAAAWSRERAEQCLEEYFPG